MNDKGNVMEVDFYVRCQFDDTLIRNTVGEFIDGDTRPILDDDVEEKYREMFNIIDDFPEPMEICLVDENVIQFVMSLGGYDFDDEIEIVISGLMKIGASNIVSIMWDGECLTGFYQCSNGHKSQVTGYDTELFRSAEDSGHSTQTYKLLSSVVF